MAYKLNPFTGNFDQVLDKAAEIKYSNTSSGLTSTTTQAAIDELQTKKQASLAIVSASIANFTAASNTIILSKYNAGIRYIELPAAISSANAQIVVKDAMGTAENANRFIVVFCNSGAVDGDSLAIINSNYGTLTFVCDGTDWYIV